MAKSGSDAFNTLVLACPDGSTFTHDKDFPTMVFESAFYAAGEDDAYAEKLSQDGARTASQRVPPRVGGSSDGAFTHSGPGIGAAPMGDHRSDGQGLLPEGNTCQACGLNNGNSKQAQVLSDESDAFTDKIARYTEGRKLQGFECYCLHPKEITHLEKTCEKLIELHPARKDNEIFWQRMNSGHTVSFGILLEKLGFLLGETECPTHPSSGTRQSAPLVSIVRPHETTFAC